jgi:hypothetical protein
LPVLALTSLSDRRPVICQPRDCACPVEGCLLVGSAVLVASGVFADAGLGDAAEPVGHGG